MRKKHPSNPKKVVEVGIWPLAHLCTPYVVDWRLAFETHWAQTMVRNHLSASSAQHMFGSVVGKYGTCHSAGATEQHQGCAQEKAGNLGPPKITEGIWGGPFSAANLEVF